jgi:hypothetical protein
MPSAHDQNLLDLRPHLPCGENVALTFGEREVLRQCERSPGSRLGSDWTMHEAARTLHAAGYLLPVGSGYSLTTRGRSALEVLRG